ncbi:MAG: TRAP transporter substrate-binding protein [Fusobacteriaceae bacterium]|jgi:tripartite ATP-independent transporter DctP family solute receptor|nr:TRAP transporter substrate-binding protein [Fusobacteriaceae bacterium]
MKKITGMLLALVMSIVAFSTILNAAGKKIELVIGHIVAEDNTWHKASLKFKETVEAKSKGQIEVKIFPNNQLGTELDVIQSILTGGGADIVFTGESMQTYAEELGIIGMPYGITSDEHMDKVLKGEVGKELEDLMLKSGLRVLGYFTRGPRNITSNIPIKTPDDLKGFIIRTPQSPMTVSAFEAMGAKPTPMAFSEVFTSLQQGVINGQENPLAMIKTGAFNEVQKYVDVTEHLRGWVYIAIGEEKFQSLSKELQQIVLDAGKEMQEYEHGLFLVEEKALKAELEGKGMTFLEVDQKPFKEKAIEGVRKVLTPKQTVLYEKIVAADK